MTDEELDQRKVGCILITVVGLMALAFFVLALGDTLTTGGI